MTETVQISTYRFIALLKCLSKSDLVNYLKPSLRDVLALISEATVIIQRHHGWTNTQRTPLSTLDCPATYPGWQLNTTWTTVHLQTLTLPVLLAMETSLRSLQRSAGPTRSIISVILVTA